jgi:DNA-binding MarR family transcriptional regulator
MPKVLLQIQVDESTNSALRACAEEVGVSISSLADLLIRAGRERFTTEQLKQWSVSQGLRRGRLAGGLTLFERATLAALRRLTVGDTRYLDAGSVAHEAGYPPRIAIQSLKRLEARGLVRSSTNPDSALDRWGRPVDCIWTLTDEGKAVRL